MAQITWGRNRNGNDADGKNPVGSWTFGSKWLSFFLFVCLFVVGFCV